MCKLEKTKEIEIKKLLARLYYACTCAFGEKEAEKDIIMLAELLYSNKKRA